MGVHNIITRAHGINCFDNTNDHNINSLDNTRPKTSNTRDPIKYAKHSPRLKLETIYSQS